MGRRKTAAAAAPPRSSSKAGDAAISELREKHKLDLENLTLTKQPLWTLYFFMLAILQYSKRLSTYILSKGASFVLLIVLVVALGFLLVVTDGLHKKHVQEFLNYAGFGLWWISLGVASSIGLGSGLHTFVLYLGPHIALFTIKAVQCGRIDLKTAPYDTIQLETGPSWLDKKCSEFGPPVYQSSAHSVSIPVFELLPQVQLEAVLWGIGTALGELPPYFISRAASSSGSEPDVVKELDAAASKEDGPIASTLKQTKRWLLSHSQHLNFFTILLLASNSSDIRLQHFLSKQRCHYLPVLKSPVKIGLTKSNGSLSANFSQTSMELRSHAESEDNICGPEWSRINPVSWLFEPQLENFHPINVHN